MVRTRALSEGIAAMLRWVLLLVLLGTSPCRAEDHPAVIRIGQSNAAALRELAYKRQELDALQADVARLEKETGFSGRVQIVARCVEMPETVARRLGIQIEQGSQAAKLTILDRQAMSRIEASTAPSNGVRTLAHQPLVARNGEKAVAFSGGEFPIPLPGGKVLSREFGTKVEATPRSIGNRRVQVDLTVSLSERALTESLKVSNAVIPSAQERRVTSSIELGLGETGAIMFPAAPPQPASKTRKPDAQVVSLLLLSVDEVDATAPAAD